MINMLRKEFQIFDEFIMAKGLRHTDQRNEILSVFLATERHVSIDELFKLVKIKYPHIGYTTVYRTMKLLSESGLCGETDFGDGVLRFEHKYGHEHHDHLICVKCGKFTEVADPRVEKLQENMVKRHGFKSLKHKLEVFGICRKCLA